MTVAAERLVANIPGRMQSHSARRALAQPQCVLQEQGPEEFHNTMCEAIHHDDRKLRIRNDAEAFRLNTAFVRAHGIPRGEVTTFSNQGSMVSAGATKT